MDKYLKLLFNCPKNKKNSECPFTDLRKLPLRERIEKEMELSEEEKLIIMKKHQECMLKQQD